MTIDLSSAAPSSNGNAIPLSRRTVLRRMTAAGVVAGIAVATGNVAVTASDSEILTVDVLMDGRTWVMNRTPPGDETSVVRRGDTFLVQGLIYPAGTIEGGVSDPRLPGSIGIWICKGTFMFAGAELAAGAVPHVTATQLYLFDDFNGLTSEGMEGGIQTVRVVTGGYGSYAGRRGEVVETPISANDTTLDLGDGVLVPASNLRFDFRFTR